MTEINREILQTQTLEFREAATQLMASMMPLVANIVECFVIEDPDAAVSATAAHCVKAAVGFEPEKGSAFNYMTTTALNYLREHHASPSKPDDGTL